MKIKSLILSMLAIMATAFTFTSCSDDDDNTSSNIESEYAYNDNLVAQQKASSKKDQAILLIAFGSTWNNAFEAFDETKAAYEKAFPNADVYVSFSSDICINRASIGEHEDANGNLVQRDYYEPRYLLHAIGKAQYSKITVQSLQVIPGEEFANVVASVKKFLNNGYISSAHLDDKYLESVEVRLGVPLLNDPDDDVPAVAAQLDKIYSAQAKNGVVAFMGHGNPDTYDTFKANIRYTQLEEALQTISPNYYVGTVDMPDNYKQNVLSRIQANSKTTTAKTLTLQALMSIAGDHAHNDMIGGYDGNESDYWDASEPESEDNSWFEYFKNVGKYTSINCKLDGETEPIGLLEIEGVRNIWIQHTKNAELLEDAYHSMYPEE